MIEKFLNIKNSLRNISDEQFENILPILASELEDVSFYVNYNEKELKDDWVKLQLWNSNVQSIASTNRIGMKLCEHFFPNFYKIQNKKGNSFHSLWKANNLTKVLKWNRKSHTTPYLSELKRGIYFNYNLAKSTMYRPQMAKMIVTKLKAKRVLDPCAGWGGRMLGCIASGAEYVAFEPNTETYNGLMQLIEFLNIGDKVRIIKDSALEMEKYNIGEFDLILTSPPYFDLEVYSDENTQSIKGCDTYKIWVDKFLEPLTNLALGHLKEDGWSCWNVHSVGKMKMIDDIKYIHKNYPHQTIFSIISSKRQTNQTNNAKKNSDVTICYTKNSIESIDNNSVNLNKFF
jgi:16S rRNA G966 N2-methylase RsmD